MDARDIRIYEEAVALWLHLFGPPPPAEVDGQTMLAMIAKKLSDVRYERLCSPHLRPSQVTLPRWPDGRPFSG